MRALVSRGLLVPPLVCAALVFGQAGTAAAVGDVGRAVPGPSIAEAAVRADAGMDTFLDSLLEESTLPDGTRLDPASVGTRLDPALADGTRLDPAVADGARLDPAAATSYAAEIRAWGATVQERLRGLDTSANRTVTRAADPVDDLITQVQTAVNSLLSSLTSLDLGGVLSAVTGLLSPVLGLITGLLGGLVPDLPDVPVA
ncbi:hypothetical protein SAMN06272735_6796 [Streptomyces sp. TLI_55]|uniref:hypothetical protein n=1 Tax=Streptomyces sp. TLI_55 TaxID=1938861 RepID=UPI000BD25A9D|nr:hypothetical protein [Streptomyces sp. TLI_55]SNX64967.1 hypothetical protein SAMN06272735_6796 [Streptomyces sp. TLI_55]